MVERTSGSIVTALILLAVAIQGVWAPMGLRAAEDAAPGPQGTDREGKPEEVYVVPIREPIMPPLVYLVRRGVKEAMAAEADLLVLDMETLGGRVDSTEEIIKILDRFPGEIATFVNGKAISAGAFISVSTQEIYMAPQAVIGASAPVMGGPGGAGGQEMPETMEKKMISFVSAIVRAQAQKNGHSVDVVEAMVDMDKVLKRDGEILCEKGQLLTLTASEAVRTYGDPAEPLLATGIVSDIDELLGKTGYAGAKVTQIEPTGAERLARWINQIRPILLLIGLLGIYLEFKAPGFGIPGIAGLVAFGIYFFGNYVAGLSGMEWLAVFLLGMLLVAFELFILPGMIIPGLMGGALVLLALVMGMVDAYPGGPPVPSMEAFNVPLRDLGIAVGAALVFAVVLARVLPHTSVYQTLVSHSVSGEGSVTEAVNRHSSMEGREGVTLSVLSPGGKARFGDDVIDVVSAGEQIPKGQNVRIVRYSSYSAVVEPVR